MYTLLLRLAGPLQSWGADSKFEIRYTENAPTKSGIIGMIAAALGRRRDESLEDLSNLQYGVRIDQPGEVIEDFHTARKDEKTSYITRRYYLSDAVFVVGIESDDPVKLEDIKNALQYPEFPLFLGRRSCPPDPRMVLGIVEKPLEQALKECPLQGRKNASYQPRILLESKNGRAVRRVMDDPVSFNPTKREYRSRLVSSVILPPSEQPESLSTNLKSDSEHDPFAELEGTR
ncbi:type I-E CRISPR-associated protein Cas5/CasD [Allobaculum mucilyticum]|uniref:type I-E CRISPR-associated protein Cas5/CasD n=1 Tax=Allobaculum mucilyticum TaxID=2834459 RepID=UPI001E3AB371|nr:type I-E CRISPR-associated protein Cas5/CasD [Allobaculum mucilyticum]UNT95280.1 type I-E CRISPR-associated protein Cas5/CasD [Allobaculum mucilyticum]